MILEASIEAETQRIRTKRTLNFELASLIRLGFHAPDKFPSFDKFIGNEKRAEQGPEDLHDYLMALSLRPDAKS